MHLYLAVRGILHQINRWENDLSATYYPFVYAPGEIGQLQLSIRPIRLYEVVFPEPMLMTLLRKIQPAPAWNPAYNKYVWGMRKALKLDEVPKEIPQRITSDAFSFTDVNVTAIGLKKDRFENGIEQI